MRPACCHSRRLSESRMRENLTYGLMRGRRKRAIGLLDRDTHPKGEKRPGVAGPATVPRHCPTLRLLNLLDKLPLKQQAEARSLLTRIPYAETREEAARQKRTFQTWCTKRGHPEAARALDRDWERMVTFYQFPREHWKHLRTSNPVESPFAAVRLRPAAAKRFKKVENATAVLWKTLLIAQKTFRRLDAPELLADVARGAMYVQGVRAVNRRSEGVGGRSQLHT